jgi:hypothetical protein
MTTANLPVRFEIENTASAADITMKWICYSVDSEGGDEGQLPIQNSISSGLTSTALANGSYRPILAIRAATVMGGGAIRNRGLINPISIDVLNTGNGPISVQVWLNPTTLTQNGGAITWANAGNLAQYAAFTDVDDTVAGGTLRDNFFVTATAQNKGVGSETFHQRIPLVYTLLNSVQDTLVVWCTEFGRMPFFQKGAKGRDHNPDGFTCWMTGAGVKTGVSHGQTDELGQKAVADIHPLYHFNATILHLLGLDFEKLSFEHNGVQRRLTNVEGKVIPELLA